MDNRETGKTIGSAAMLRSFLKNIRVLARILQLAGDRVQTEYYFQFADHYFRLLSESRARFEDQNQRRPRDDDFDDEGDEDMAEVDSDGSGDEQSDRDLPDGRQDRSQERATARIVASAFRAEIDRGGRNPKIADQGKTRRPNISTERQFLLTLFPLQSVGMNRKHRRMISHGGLAGGRAIRVHQPTAMRKSLRRPKLLRRAIADDCFYRARQT